MIAAFLRRLWPRLPDRARRRLAGLALGAALVAGLDAVGVTLVLPLARLVTALDRSTVPSELDVVADALGTDDPGRLAVLLAVAVVVLFVAKGVLALLLLRANLRTALGAEAAMARDLLRRYLHAPLELHLGRNSADLQRTLHESLRRVYQEALATSVPALGDALVMVAVALVLLVFAPLEALVGAVFMAALVHLYRRLTETRARASSAELVDAGERSIRYVQQALSAVREIRVSRRADTFADELLEVREVVAERQRLLTLTEMLPRYYLELGVVIGAGLVGAVAFARHEPERAVAVLALFLAAALRLLPSLNRLMVAEAKARAALPHLDRIESDLDTLPAGPSPDGRPEGAPQHDEPFRALALEGVTYRYPGREAPALSEVSLEVRRGERIVFVGRSGSGKTTAVHLVLGLLSPESGAVTVNGRPLGPARAAWGPYLAYVPQDVALLDASFATNVALGVPDDEVEAARVDAALAAAHLTELVESTPDGRDRAVGEGGSRLSGGQRQRLGLARAFYQEPQVLVLDEITSALDATTEARVLATLDELPPDVTVVGIAHRPAAIRCFDRIALFDDGRLVATGPLDELRAAHPLLDELLREGDDGT